MTDFWIGQKVVCVSTFARMRRRHPRVRFPEFEKVYTIRAFCNAGPVPAILLQEVTNRWPVRFAVTHVWAEPSFRTDKFRPLVDRKTDISVFTAMLNPKRVEERV